ncbi:MAG: class I SAM-dependent methyltransferase [Nitrospirota bacterium]|nr:class I SAM-dependent methyltransferase [Nitrospirota bacterium]
MKDTFKEKAVTWDQNPLVLEIAGKFTEELIRRVRLNREMVLLEFGCGTGQVGMRLHSLVNSIIMVDNSAAMLSHLREKMAKEDIRNMTVFEGDIKEMVNELPQPDLIYSLMSLHHVSDIPGLLSAFRQILKPGGDIIVSDLLTEDGSFHGDEKVPHNGFSPEELRRLFDAQGLSIKGLEIYHTIKKPGPDNTIREYEQFILSARHRDIS